MATVNIYAISATDIWFIVTGMNAGAPYYFYVKNTNGTGVTTAVTDPMGGSIWMSDVLSAPSDGTVRGGVSGLSPGTGYYLYFYGLSDTYFETLNGYVYNYYGGFNASGSISWSLSTGNGCYIAITSGAAGTLTAYTSGNLDTYGYLSNSHGYDSSNGIPYGMIVSNDDGGEGNNCLITYSVEANTTYYFYVRPYNSSYAGDITITWELTATQYLYNTFYNFTTPMMSYELGGWTYGPGVGFALKMVPAISGKATIWSTCDSGDPYGYLTEDVGSSIHNYDRTSGMPSAPLLAVNDDGYGNSNFLITYEVEANKAYWIWVRPYGLASRYNLANIVLHWNVVPSYSISLSKLDQRNNYLSVLATVTAQQSTQQIKWYYKKPSAPDTDYKYVDTTTVSAGATTTGMVIHNLVCNTIYTIKAELLADSVVQKTTTGTYATDPFVWEVEKNSGEAPVITASEWNDLTWCILYKLKDFNGTNGNPTIAQAGVVVTNKYYNDLVTMLNQIFGNILEEKTSGRWIKASDLNTLRDQVNS